MPSRTPARRARPSGAMDPSLRVPCLSTSDARGGADARRRRHALRSEITSDELAHRILDTAEQRATERARARANSSRRRAGEATHERTGCDLREEPAPRELCAPDERRLVRRQLPYRHCNRIHLSFLLE